jgi:hypothetical protein
VRRRSPQLSHACGAACVCYDPRVVVRPFVDTGFPTSCDLGCVGSNVMPRIRYSGDGDMDTTGRCASDITHFCPEVKPGEGRIVKCLNNQKADEEKGNVDGRKLADECKEEIRNFKIERCVPAFQLRSQTLAVSWIPGSSSHKQLYRSSIA